MIMNNKKAEETLLISISSAFFMFADDLKSFMPQHSYG